MDPSDFSDLKIEVLKQSKCNTCSPIMNTSTDVNWMRSALVICAKLNMQIKD